MALYVVGQHGGNAIPVGDTRFFVDGLGNVLAKQPGEVAVVIYSGKPADALNVLKQLVAALDPSAVQIAGMVPAGATP